MYDPPRERSNFDDVGNFHEKYGLDNVSHHPAGPRKVPSDVLEFRGNFMLEELQEFFEAIGGTVKVSELVVAGARTVTVQVPENAEVDHAKAFDALIDLVYVAMGTAHFLGYPWENGWRAVQKANMAKVRAKADGSNSLRGHALDVVKPPGWTPPDIKALLEQFGWDRQTPHDFEAFDGSSGYACTRMVLRSGHGEDCGLPADHPIHTKVSGQ